MEQIFGENAGTLKSTLREAWDHSQERLEGRWRTIDAKKFNPKRLCLWHYKEDCGPTLVSQSTRVGIQEQFGVCRTKAKYNSFPGYGSLVLPSKELLATLSNFNGHEKLELLSGQPGPEYAKARAAFDARRFDDMVRGAITPMRDLAMLAFTSDSLSHTSITLPDGETGEAGEISKRRAADRALEPDAISSEKRWRRSGDKGDGMA